MLRVVATLLSLQVLCLVGCGGGAASDDASNAGGSEGALHHDSDDFRSYASAYGVAALGDDAHELREAIKAHGGTDLGYLRVLAGFTGDELGWSGEDATETFGILCQAKSANITLKKDNCTLNATVRASEAEKKGDGEYEITLHGKLAEKIAKSLPRHGSDENSAGTVKCKSDSDSAGWSCVVPISGTVTSFKQSIDDEMMTATHAKKLIKAFE